jgi:hypothetical protein
MPLVAVGVTGGSVICYFISYMMALADFGALGKLEFFLYSMEYWQFYN